MNVSERDQTEMDMVDLHQIKQEVKNEEVSLDELFDGALLHRFRQKLTEVIENIWDGNYPSKDKRKLTIELVFSPDDHRSTIDVSAKISAKLPGRIPEKTMLSIRAIEGKPQVREIHISQGSIL